MISKLTYSLILILSIVFTVSAQEDPPPTDDLGNVSDAFQENFFEALKQKGIENYELALTALQKAERAADGRAEYVAVVQFEKGKNLAKLKRYDEAEERYLQVLESQGERLEVLEALYDVYFQRQNYEAAIPLVEKLIKFDQDYKEDLANLYHRTQQYEKALELLDELDAYYGENAYRDALRRQIYKVTGNTEGAISNLETRIDKNPKKEQDYLNLIFLYSEQGDEKKAFETAKELLKNQPNSKLVHLALYKFYLDQGNADEALKSMRIVFESSEVNKESKFRVLSDFVNYANDNPGYDAVLEELTSYFTNEDLGGVFEQLGLYFVGKGDREKALRFYELGVAKDPDNFSLIKNCLLLMIDNSRFDSAAKLSEDSLEIFPAQPLLYLLNGIASIELGREEAAIDRLKEGLDYLFDDPQMEKDIYEQLSRAYSVKGDESNATKYADKAANITIDN